MLVGGVRVVLMDWTGLLGQVSPGAGVALRAPRGCRGKHAEGALVK